MKSTVLVKPEEWHKIIDACEVCHVAMTDPAGMPYNLPFNFGFDEGTVYLHSGPEGKKIGILENNPNVCISFSTDYQLRAQSEKVACSYGMKYRSVLYFGRVEFISDYDEKVRVLNLIMKKYTGRDDFTYNPPAIMNVKVMKVIPAKIEGKVYGWPL